MTPITLAQFFHWYYPADGSLWNQLKEKAPELAHQGITAVWLPPAYKGASGGYSVGYDTYDLFDLGEFDQKGSVRTKYGTKADYLAAIEACHKHGIKVIADVVFNHKAGADEAEKMLVRKVDPTNRKEFISDPFEIEAWTKFTFPGRGKQYSDFIWDHTCFSGIDWAKDIEESGIFSIQNEFGEGWEELTEEELGNYDYLMSADIEFRNPHVREELKKWGRWYLELTKVDGFRLDAVKHMSPKMINEWADYVQAITKEHLFIVGEYWNIHRVEALQHYVDATSGRVQLFDAPLHQNFYVASRMGKDYDLQHIFDNSLVSIIPQLAVTLVDNHDTQPLQELESPVEAWFKPIAYALILLRQAGTPCVFYPALYGAHYKDQGDDGQEHEIWLSAVEELPAMIRLRKLLSEGDQHDYFDHPNCIGWVRTGTVENELSGFAVVVSNGSDGWKYMELGTHKAGRKMVDLLGKNSTEIELNDKGGAEFPCPAGNLSIWVTKELAQNFSSL
ncbi:alpha-amylase [Flavihumibacter sp. CACIAM 22H1]|uniref:alpha-amylase n=1 Tax=Flavihumibacter sp. CACIAM 22H1 TaxID=1812911 RepID=UPI0007A8780F|nr:alpha-amylase [Flavihumibacter sp. CACIAM 22H1]KYP15229.1 MAG: alpha-amylase [Flavihumibacter sp. CACIAM 22H1]